MMGVKVAEATGVEARLWATLRAFEAVACANYERHAPELATSAKRAVLAELSGVAADDTGGLASAVRELLAHADSPDAIGVLLIQGVVLERLGSVVYAHASVNSRLSESGRALAARGAAACATAMAAAATRLPSLVGDGAMLLAAFEARTGEVIRRVDALGEAVDAAFSAPLQLSFADVMGDFTAELLDACVSLGMPRRQLIVFLTGRLMGM